MIANNDYTIVYCLFLFVHLQLFVWQGADVSGPITLDIAAVSGL